jgi:hypothetical protein
MSLPRAWLSPALPPTGWLVAGIASQFLGISVTRQGAGSPPGVWSSGYFSWLPALLACLVLVLQDLLATRQLHHWKKIRSTYNANLLILQRHTETSGSELS